ncbi:hypothetical protein [Sphingobium sp.]|uniref:hypothetical protein n=1 Tax=Sphingobium sp. TaxID=1912891 RepID=UPI003BB774DC
MSATTSEREIIRLARAGAADEGFGAGEAEAKQGALGPHLGQADIAGSCNFQLPPKKRGDPGALTGLDKAFYRIVLVMFY